jgi:DNA-binding NarL/FixJ family response regulator
LLLGRESDITVVAQAGSLAEARQALIGMAIDLAIVDLALPDGDGVELVRELRHANPNGTVLVLTAETDRRHLAQAVEAGASGVLHKASSLDEIIGAIRRLSAGESLLSSHELISLIELLRLAGQERDHDRDVETTLGRLTPREREVLQGLADGLSDKEIAERLHVSDKTVRAHMASLLDKLGVESRLQAVLYAIRHGAIVLK